MFSQWSNTLQQAQPLFGETGFSSDDTTASSGGDSYSSGDESSSLSSDQEGMNRHFQLPESSTTTNHINMVVDDHVKKNKKTTDTLVAHTTNTTQFRCVITSWHPKDPSILHIGAATDLFTLGSKAYPLPHINMKLACASHSIFLSVCQRFIHAGHSSLSSQEKFLLETSRRYLALLHEQCALLSKSVHTGRDNLLGETIDNNRRTLYQQQLALYQQSATLWHICELFYLTPSSLRPVGFVKWLQFCFSSSSSDGQDGVAGTTLIDQLDDFLAEQVSQKSSSHKSSSSSSSSLSHNSSSSSSSHYYFLLCRSLIYGYFSRALELIESLEAPDQTLSIVSILLNTMPSFHNTAALVDGTSLRQQWSEWRTSCREQYTQQEHAGSPALHALAILAGNTSVICQYAEQWFEMFVAELFYRPQQHSTSTSFGHVPLSPTEQVATLYQLAFNAYSHPKFARGGHTQRATSIFSLIRVIHQNHQASAAKMGADRDAALAVVNFIHEQVGSWWLSAHLADLLHHGGMLKTAPLPVGMPLRDYYLLEYGSAVLAPHANLLELALDYFSECGQLGSSYQRTFVQRHCVDSITPLNERHALKMLRLCAKHDLPASISRQIKLHTASLYMREKRFACAIRWFVYARHYDAIQSLANQLIDTLTTCDAQTLSDLAQVIPTLNIHPPINALLFLQYYEKLQHAKSAQQRASLILKLLRKKIAPKRIWAGLISDLMPLIALPKLAHLFQKSTIYFLMQCFQSLLVTEHTLTPSQIQNIRATLTHHLAFSIATNSSLSSSSLSIGLDRTIE